MQHAQPSDIAARSGRTVVRLGAAVDAERMLAPAVAVMDAGVLVAVDTPEAIGRIDAPAVDRSGHVALPPLVNAHAHLDLTSVGPVPFDGTFAHWAAQVRERRASKPQEIEASVQEGVRRSAAGGTGFIGDIAGNFGLTALEALRAAAPAAGIEGVSFVEAFGIGNASARGVEFLRGLAERVPAELGGIRLGASPHAPYSCDDAVYRAAAELGIPVATHLSETLDEVRFVRDGSGPFEGLLQSVGAWTPELRGWACDPVARVLPLVRGRGALLVHLNYLTDAAVDMLAVEGRGDRPPVAVYCPRASAFFRHPAEGHAPHRYRELLAAGVPVALGTDSAIVLGDGPAISVLDEMRLLHRRDGTHPRLLVAMATVHGAQALGVARHRVLLPRAGAAGARNAIVVPAGPADGPPGEWLRRALDSDRPCEWLGAAA